MTTNVAASLLPMSDDYLQVMIPVPPDAGEALGLTRLKHRIHDQPRHGTGTIVNREDEPISDVVAVVEMQDTTARFPQDQEIPVMPVELAPMATGTFTAMATLQEK